MSNKNNWGGKRDGAGSGGKRPNTGPKRRRHKFSKFYHVERERIGSDNPFTPPQQWRVLSVSDTELEFQDLGTEDIIVLSVAEET